MNLIKLQQCSTQNEKGRLDGSRGLDLIFMIISLSATECQHGITI